MRRGLILSALIVAALLPLGVFAQSSSVYPPVIRVGPQSGVDTDPTTALATQSLAFGLIPVPVTAGGTSCSSGSTALTALRNVITGGTSGQYVTMPVVATGITVELTSDMPVSINVCPSSTLMIWNPGTSGLSAGSPVSISPGGYLRLYCMDTVNCYAK